MRHFEEEQADDSTNENKTGKNWEQDEIELIRKQSKKLLGEFAAAKIEIQELNSQEVRKTQDKERRRVLAGKHETRYWYHRFIMITNREFELTPSSER